MIFTPQIIADVLQLYCALSVHSRHEAVEIVLKDPLNRVYQVTVYPLEGGEIRYNMNKRELCDHS